MNKSNFLYPHRPYHKKLTLNTLAFNANLQQFSHQVGYICNLHTGGKLSTHQAYDKLESLWQELKSTKQSLKI